MVKHNRERLEGIILVVVSQHKYRMRFHEITEGLNHSTMEVFHYTSAENLRAILTSDRIETGASKHEVGDQTLYGVSTTRNRHFDISNTYAVSGKKSWRIGLDYRKLRERFRVMPIRDEYLRKVPRGKRTKQQNSLGLFGPRYSQLVSSDEMEEFVLGDIAPLSRFITSIAVEDAAVDISLHPHAYARDQEEYEEDFEIEGPDQYLVFDILASLHPEFFNKLSVSNRYGTYEAQFVPIPHVPFFFIDRDYHRDVPAEKALAWLLD